LFTIAAALTPILIFAGFRSYLNAQDALAERRTQLIEIADRAIDEIEQILSTVDTLEQIYLPNIVSGQCEEVYRTLSPRIPQLATITYFDAEGITQCSAIGEAGGTVAQPSAFARLKAGEEMVRTDAFFGPQTQAWLFSVLRRVENADGEFMGAVAFPLKTEQLVRTVRLTNLPEDVELAISDGDGQVFGSARIVAVNEDWISEATGDVDGALFVTSTQQLGSVDIVVREIVNERMYAIISRPSPGLFSEFTLEPLESVGIPLLSFSLALIAAWLAVDGLVLKWLARLRRLALIYGEGHYNFRIGNEFENAPDEISDFAYSFDRMANRISERDGSLRAAIATRDSAVKEIHHRVKNNLQIVASFLNLQRRQVSDPAAREVISAARTGFELDLDQPEQSRQKLLFEAYILDPLVGHRAGRARQHAAIDADIRGPDSIGQAAPAQIGEQQVEPERDDHQREEVDDDIVEIALIEDREPADDDREDKLADQRRRTHCKSARVGPERCWGVVFAHRVSRLMAVRMSSRMAAASACRSPGSDTEALCVPAVCTVSVARPKARSSGP